MRRLAALGCAMLVGVSALVAGYLYATGLWAYLWAYFLAMLAAAPNSEDWEPSQAVVEKSTISHTPSLGYRGSITLRYDDMNGATHRREFRVYSMAGRIGEAKTNDVIAVDVCRHDPSIIASAWFRVSGARECEPRKVSAQTNVDL